jgi:tetratricopeptide (TPR) repeat protein
LAEIGVRQSLFNAAGFFPTATFSNIINTACYLKKYAWANTFIKNWLGCLDPEDRFIAGQFASARVNFEEGNFRDALGLLRQIIHYKNTHFALHIRILLARASFEQKEDVGLQNSQCAAFDIFIRRSTKMKPELKKSISDFLKILRFLIHEKPKNQILKALEIKGNTIASFEWLKEKIDA